VCAAFAAIALHAAMLFALLMPLPRVGPISAAHAVALPLVASIQLASFVPETAGVPVVLLPEVPASTLAITLPALPPLVSESVVSDAFEAAREAESSAEASELEHLQGLYVGQIRGRLSRVLEMAATTLPERGPCEVRVIQNERGEVLDVDLSGCAGSDARKTRLAMAMHRASPLPLPPAGLAPGSSLRLDLSEY
jgi:hypothetical protein